MNLTVEMLSSWNSSFLTMEVSRTIHTCTEDNWKRISKVPDKKNISISAFFFFQCLHFSCFLCTFFESEFVRETLEHKHMKILWVLAILILRKCTAKE